MKHPRLSFTVFALGLALLVLSPALSSAQDAERSKAPEKVPGLPDKIPGTLDTAAVAALAPEAVFGRKIDPVKRFEGDHLAAGISVRNRGGGVINLRGAPEGATAIGAHLYWDVLDNKSPRTMTVSINGVAVTGTLIGQGPTPCWSPSANFAYRAEVPLYLLYNGINGDYKIAGIPSSTGTGADPWQSNPGAPLAEGATLVVFFRAPNAPFKVTVVYEAPVSGQEFAGSFSATLTGFNALGGTARFTLIGADGQIGFGLFPSTPVTQEKSFFQGTQIAGPGGSNNDSDWNGQDTEPLSQLWDTRTQIVPIKQGSGNAVVRYQAGADCLVVVAFVLSL